MDSQSSEDEITAPIAPLGWEKATETSDSEESECNSSSQTAPLSRHPSLAEIIAIAENCITSPLMKSKAANEQEKAKKSEDLEPKSTKQVLVVRSSVTQLNNCPIPATPPKVENSRSTTTQTHSGDEPLTPTANLKMLVSAASPAIRDREIKKRELFTDSDPRPRGPAIVPSFALPIFDVVGSKVVIRDGASTRVEVEEKIAISRKDKSLGLLCQRFLAKYPENPPVTDTIEISLDEVAKDLSVERRRIYDIVNVLESVEVISRFAKNRYMWHGKTRLPQTLLRLKKLARTRGFSLKPGYNSFEKENPDSPPSQSHMLARAPLNSQCPRLLPKDFNVPNPIPQSQPNSQELDDEMIAWAKKQREADYCRKDKSLGVLSQKFLMMFLISETRQVTLDDAANLLIDNSEEGQAKYKTKVRRLYDIANILSSLQLIQKVHIHHIAAGRKPGFRWIGMDLDKLEEWNRPKCCGEAPPPKKRVSYSNQSLLAEIEDKEESLFGRLISRRPSQHQIRCSTPYDNNSKLPRSRSDCLLGSKKGAMSCDGDSSQESLEDGYSIQEISETQDTPVSGSPTAAKFQSELKKLQEQYPDRMSQLLSACRQGLVTPDSIDSKKSRRVLFTQQANTKDEPEAKKSKPDSECQESMSESESYNLKTFVHSATSPFKPIQADEAMVASQQSPSCTTKSCIEEEMPSSPEQKILQEREKQKKLLEEQKGFQLQDERWKRMEQQLDTAFPQKPITSPSTVLNTGDQSSVGIQANLIEDVSPIKPLSSYYVKGIPAWHPILPMNTAALNVSRKSATPSPQFQNMGVPASPSVTPISSVTPTSSVTANSSVTATSLAPQGQVTSTDNLALANQATVANIVALANQVTDANKVYPANQVTVTTMAPANQVPIQSMASTNQVPVPNMAPVNQVPVCCEVQTPRGTRNGVLVPVSYIPTSVWASASRTLPSGQSTPSPIFLKLAQPTFNSSALYSPRSLTSCSTPTTDVDLNDPKDLISQLLGKGNKPLPVSTMSLPVSFVNSLLNNPSTAKNITRIQLPMQRIRLKTQQPLEEFGSPVVMTPQGSSQTSPECQLPMIAQTSQAFQSPMTGTSQGFGLQTVMTAQTSQGFGLQTVMTAQTSQGYQSPVTSQGFGSQTVMTPQTSQAFQSPITAQGFGSPMTPQTSQAFQSPITAQGFGSPMTPQTSQAFQSPITAQGFGSQTEMTPQTSQAFQSPITAQGFGSPMMTEGFGSPMTPQTSQAFQSSMMSQGFGSQMTPHTSLMTMTPIQRAPDVTMATPILPKGTAPLQHAFGALPGETPSNSATFTYTDVAKSLVLPELNMSQNNS